MRSYCWSNFGFRKVIQISAGLIWAQLIENLKISPRKSCLPNFTLTPQTIGTSSAPLSFFGFHNESAYISQAPLSLGKETSFLAPRVPPFWMAVLTSFAL